MTKTYKITRNDWMATRYHVALTCTFSTGESVTGFKVVGSRAEARRIVARFMGA
jgi:hypothetical protein